MQLAKSVLYVYMFVLKNIDHEYFVIQDAAQCHTSRF